MASVRGLNWIKLTGGPRRRSPRTEAVSGPVRFSARLGALVSNDIEVLIIRGRLKIRCDCIELGILRSPGRANRESCASLSQLAFTEIIRHVDEVEFMLDVCAFNDLSKPLPLNSSVARKVEDH